MQNIRLNIVNFFDTYYLVLLIAVILILTTYISGSKTIRKPSFLHRQAHNRLEQDLLRPSLEGIQLSDLPAKLAGNTRQDKPAKISRNVLLAQRQHTAAMLKLLRKELSLAN